MLDSEVLTKSAPSVAALDIAGLSYRYHNGQQALKDVSFTLQPDEKVALIGPNGAGKSTLLLHLNGIFKAQAGRVRIFGQETIDANLGEIRALVGLVFQNPDDQLFSPRVFDDVAFGPLYMGLPEGEIRQRVGDALACVGMGGFEERRPHELSIGERKRVALATVLSMNPRLLALDEPSAGLDPRARRGLINLLGDLPQAMLVSTHDMHLVKDLFKRIIIMDSGAVVADGRTEDILADVDLLELHGLEGT
ncbi:MAG: ATP-binding cassette domain-containing protein [Dehalococcoidia bacterium]|nr:ATP-binding cassette domain-containing protein [Dehalococcoidia bacterium]